MLSREEYREMVRNFNRQDDYVKALETRCETFKRNYFRLLSENSKLREELYKDAQSKFCMVHLVDIASTMDINSFTDISSVKIYAQGIKNNTNIVNVEGDGIE